MFDMLDIRKENLLLIFFGFLCTLQFYLEKWPNPLMWRNRDGIFLLEWRSHERRKKNFPMNHERHIIYGGAGVVKINFPMSGEAANGEIYFHHDCCAIYYVPWVMNGEIYPSLFLHIKGFTFPYKEWKCHQNSCEYMVIWSKRLYQNQT